MVVQLGSLELTCPLGVGTNSWGDEGAEVDAVLHGALDAGVTLFDTAEYYKGSEKALGSALRKDGRHAIVCTKYLPMPWHCNVERHRLDHLNRSLEKLGLEQVDVLYIHMPISLRSIEIQAAALARMIELGKCRAVGAFISAECAGTLLIFASVATFVQFECTPRVPISDRIWIVIPWRGEIPARIGRLSRANVAAYVRWTAPIGASALSIEKRATAVGTPARAASTARTAKAASRAVIESFSLFAKLQQRIHRSRAIISLAILISLCEGRQQHPRQEKGAAYTCHGV